MVIRYLLTFLVIEAVLFAGYLLILRMTQGQIDPGILVVLVVIPGLLIAYNYRASRHKRTP